MALDGNAVGPDLLVTDRAIALGPQAAFAWNGRRFVVATHEFGTGVPSPDSVLIRAIECNCLPDHDGDGSRICDGDCDDSNPRINPDARETCDGSDENCDGQTDEDEFGEDSDSDGVHNACDNCRFAYNPSQLDTDGDLVGNSCDNCAFVVNPDQADLDADARGDLCDNCPGESNPLQDDYDGDLAGDACDNCVFDHNPSQADRDAEGDRCDLDDGYLLLSVRGGDASRLL